VSRTSGPPPAIFERTRSATFTLGSILGAMGADAALLVAGAVNAKKLELHLDIATSIGHAIRGGTSSGFALAACVGFVFGGVLALVMRHAARFFARLIFGTAATALAWFCLHLGLVSRHMETLPLPPMLAAAAFFGVVIACVPSARRI
jgi:hypothetical protein